MNPPILPMLAKRVADIPAGGGWIFEPKWDGFRTIVFRNENEIHSEPGRQITQPLLS